MPLHPLYDLALGQLERHIDEELRIRFACQRKDGTDVFVRFEPARAVLFVQAHLQRTGTGGSTYDPGTSVSSTEVDCQETRVQDLEFTLSGAHQYYLWLIPILVQGDDTKILMDGENGTPDYAFFLDLGT